MRHFKGRFDTGGHLGTASHRSRDELRDRRPCAVAAKPRENAQPRNRINWPSWSSRGYQRPRGRVVSSSGGLCTHLRE